MDLLVVPQPYSAGILLSYKCNSTCRHCLYACSPAWEADWLALEDGEVILSQLAESMRDKYSTRGRIGVNTGVHFTGGEPFLNFELLLQLTEVARRVGIPASFVETNSYWCTDDQAAREKLLALRQAGLDGILISANPFILEQVPFERTERAVRISLEVFDLRNVIVYQLFFLEQFRQLGLRGTLPFEKYLERAGYGLQHVELFASGRAAYSLQYLYSPFLAQRFFGINCERDLVRDWHVHVDNYCNLVPGFCGGLSLGDARDMEGLCNGVDLHERPVLRALLTDLELLYELGQEHGYEGKEGYVSKCHLCLDIRMYLSERSEYSELQPRAFYEHLGE